MHLIASRFLQSFTKNFWVACWDATWLPCATWDLGYLTCTCKPRGHPAGFMARGAESSQGMHCCVLPGAGARWHVVFLILLCNCKELVVLAFVVIKH
jgi:hypothetical protein